MGKVKCIYIQVVFYITMPSEKSLANFAPLFILAGMIILIPTITEKALGITFAFVYGKVDGKCPSGCDVVIDNYVLYSGRWVKTPVLYGWVTEGPPPFGGDEKGAITYKVTTPEAVQNVKMSFFNPSSGPNTCSAIVTPPGHGITAQCDISSGTLAKAEYLITFKFGTNATKSAVSPIGSNTFLTVNTKVNGGTKKPSDFTITVSGNSPSPKSFSGSSSGTSVTLNAGKYKVTGSGPSGYNIAYSSGCSGTAS